VLLSVLQQAALVHAALLMTDIQGLYAAVVEQLQAAVDSLQQHQLQHEASGSQSLQQQLQPEASGSQTLQQQQQQQQQLADNVDALKRSFVPDITKRVRLMCRLEASKDKPHCCSAGGRAKHGLVRLCCLSSLQQQQQQQQQQQHQAMCRRKRRGWLQHPHNLHAALLPSILPQATATLIEPSHDHISFHFHPIPCVPGATSGRGQSQLQRSGI
jgi:hypothetical protein